MHAPQSMKVGHEAESADGQAQTWCVCSPSVRSGGAFVGRGWVGQVPACGGHARRRVCIQQYNTIAIFSKQCCLEGPQASPVVMCGWLATQDVAGWLCFCSHHGMQAVPGVKGL